VIIKGNNTIKEDLETRPR